MALTNFAALTSQQKLVWSRDVWKEARDLSFFNKFTGTSSDSVVQRITELTRTEKGEQVIMHLLADLVDDGIVGDNEREGNEEEMLSYSDIITIDLISHGVRQKGKLAEQKTVISFREHARDRLAYWLANRMDQLGFLTMSGIAYSRKLDGDDRTTGAFATLAFASDVSAPTTNRGRYIKGAALGGAYSAIAAIDQSATDITYLSYEAIVDLVTFAKTTYLKPLMAGGKEYYVAFVRPEALAQLKKDPDYQNAIVTGLQRSEKNPFFTGGTVTVDGLVIHEHRLVYNTKGTTTNARMYDTGNSNGNGGDNFARMLICGSQAMGMADLGAPEWAEKWFNYNSSPGINVDKMFGLLKPKFQNMYTGSVEDFGVLAVDHLV
jgi:N4-gp56 family major capsid protein